MPFQRGGGRETRRAQPVVVEREHRPRIRLAVFVANITGSPPKVVLTNRMGCLKVRVVANVMIPTRDFVRFVTHFGFRPDFCEAGDRSAMA